MRASRGREEVGTACLRLIRLCGTDWEALETKFMHQLLCTGLARMT